MRYYYFNPFSKQYYFPADFCNYPVFTTFYHPYKLFAKLLWKVWNKSLLFRNLFSTDQPEKVLPIEQIKQYVTSGSTLSFNMGTVGPEQKISILGVDNTTASIFYIKYAISEVARRNVFNEGMILQQLTMLTFVPKLESYVFEDKRFTLIKTSVLTGQKMKNPFLNEQLLNTLFTLSTLKVKSNRMYASNLVSCFAHGDFCPWNMFYDQEKINIFDWEMAGQYPVGYDLFTYIFQFEFLVNKKKRFKKLLKDNSDFINRYFNQFKIDDWKIYLLEFINIKYSIESEKKNAILIKPFIELKKYVAKDI